MVVTYFNLVHCGLSLLSRLERRDWQICCFIKIHNKGMERQVRGVKKLPPKLRRETQLQVSFTLFLHSRNILAPLILRWVSLTETTWSWMILVWGYNNQTKGWGRWAADFYSESLQRCRISITIYFRKENLPPPRIASSATNQIDVARLAISSAQGSLKNP